ncbi:VOC family protein [Sorangium sp. So ce118]
MPEGCRSRTDNEAISLAVTCETQAEVDALWSKLTADGGAESQCGWLKDRFGLSWQIVPSALPRLLQHPEPAKAAWVMQAMMQMEKIDIAQIEAAAR